MNNESEGAVAQQTGLSSHTKTLQRSGTTQCANERHASSPRFPHNREHKLWLRVWQAQIQECLTAKRKAHRSRGRYFTVTARNSAGTKLCKVDRWVSADGFASALASETNVFLWLSKTPVTPPTVFVAGS
jgi:hypothetical protein